MKIFKSKTFWEIIISIPILLISLGFVVLEAILTNLLLDNDNQEVIK